MAGIVGAAAINVVGTDLTILELFLAVGILLLGGFLKGTVGFAVGLVTIAGIVQLFPPKLALIALSIPFLISNVIVLARDGIPLQFIRDQLPFIGTLSVGLFVGVAWLGVLSTEAIYLLLALYIAGFLVFQRYDAFVHGYAQSRYVGPLTGILAGILGGIVSAPGPPLIVHSYLSTIDDTRALFVTGMSSLFFLAHVIRLGFLYFGNLFHTTELTLGILFSIPIFVGVLIGAASRSYIDSRTFELLVKALLVLIGLKLLANGLGL